MSTSTPIAMQAADSGTTANKRTHRDRVEGGAFVCIALGALGVGAYAWAFLNQIVNHDKPTGLLSTKPAALLNDTFYMFSFAVHVFFGGAALIVGWTQFMHSWRLARPLVHRYCGRVYVVSVLLSAPAAIVIATNSTGASIGSAGFIGLALVWTVSTVMALASIRGRRVAEHQKWMIVSYAMTLSAVSLRIYLGIILAATRGNIVLALQITSWICWVPSFVPVWFLCRRVDREHAAKQSLHPNLHDASKS